MDNKHKSKDKGGKKKGKKKLRRNSWPAESIRLSNRQIHNNKAFDSEREDQNSEMVTKLDSLGLMVYSAIINDDMDTLKQIYKSNTVKSVDRQGNTALHVAAKANNIVILRWLLKNTSTAVMEKNYRGETCVHTAVSAGSTSHCLKTLKVIIYSGKVKPVLIASERDDNGMTVLHLATVSGHTNVVCWLAETFGRTLVIMRNNYGQTALHFAAAKGYLKIIHTIARYGKFIVNMKDKLGATPVFYAAQEGNIECLKYLMTALKGDPQIYSDHLVTPLIVSSEAGHTEVVKYLLEGCQEEHLMHQSQDGATAFHMAAANGHVKVLQILLSHKSSHEAIHIRDLSGSSPAHDAAQHSHTECLKLLVDQGLNPHQPNESGKTPYTLASQSTDQECLAYASTLKSDIIHFSPKSSELSPRSATVVPALRPPESPESSNSPERRVKTDECLLPQKRKFRRSTDILTRIKASLYNGNNKSKSAPDSPSSRLSSSSEVFLKSVSTTGPKQPYHERDKKLYHQPNRHAPVALPYVDKTVLSDKRSKEKMTRKVYDDHEFYSGESGYMSDHMLRYDKYDKSHNNDLTRARSWDNLTVDVNENYTHHKNDSLNNHVHFKNVKKQHRSRSDDYTLKSHGYLLPHKLVWTESSHAPVTYYDRDILELEKNVNIINSDQNQGKSSGIDYSRPGAVVVLSDTVTDNANKSFLHSNDARRYVQSNPPLDYVTSSDTDANSNLPPIQEQNEQNYKYDPTYSYHIPAYNYSSQDVFGYGESIYNDPDRSPVIRRKPSADLSYTKPVNYKRGRKISKSPPPLPPPRPKSQIIDEQKPIEIDTESVRSSIPSDTPPEPLIDYFESVPITTTTQPKPPPPPAPPLPPPETLHPKKMKSLAEIIKENKAAKNNNNNKKKPPKKPPRRNKKNKRKSKSQDRNNRVSPKIEQIGKILEDSGALEPFHERPPSRVDSSEIYADQYNPPSKTNSRNTSPAAPHSVSPTSPKEAPQKFSYLPNGVLLRPKLRHVDRPSLRQARKDQVTRRDHAAQKVSQRPSGAVYRPDHRSDSVDHHASRKYMNKKDAKAYNDVADSLKRRMEKRNHLPLPDFNRAKHLEETECLPSELELFFKKRKQRLEDMDLYGRQHEVLESVRSNEYLSS